MELNINKDEAQLINCALTYYLQRGAVYCSCDTHKEAADEIAEAENN